MNPSVDQVCLACQSRLGPPDGSMVRCSNPRCPAGGQFQYCGFCGHFSRGMTQRSRECWNTECRVHKKAFKFCSQCRRFSRCLLYGEERCISRHCPSNSSVLGKCEFCGNGSLLMLDHATYCTKGNCDHLFVNVERCLFCAQRSYNVEWNCCDNKQCKQYKVVLSACPSCKQIMYVEKDKLCLNDNCAFGPKNHKALAEPVSLDTFAVERVEAADAGGLHGTLPPESLAALTKARAQESFEQPKKEPSPPNTPQPQAPAPVLVNPNNERWPKNDNAAAIEDGKTTVQMPTPPQLAESIQKHREGLGLPDLDSAPSPAPEPRPKAPAEPSSEDFRLPQSFVPVEPRIPERNNPVTPAAPKPRDDAVASPKEKSEPLSMPSFGPASSVPKFQRPASATPPRPVMQTPEARPQRTGFAVPKKAQSEQSAPPAQFRVTPAKPYRHEDLFGKATDNELIQAFKVVEHRFLRASAGQGQVPLYLVLGMPGSGKTTYLSALGEMLSKGKSKYYFPYQGVRAERVQVEELLRGVKTKGRAKSQSLFSDLVYEYKTKFYDEYLAKGLWPPFTASNEHTLLLTEITRFGETVAKVVTLDIAGELYKSLLAQALSFKTLVRKTDTVLGALASLLNKAQGIMILLSPNNYEEDSRTYHDFFRLLCDELAPRSTEIMSGLASRLVNDPRLAFYYRRQLELRELIDLAEDELKSGLGLMKCEHGQVLFEAYERSLPDLAGKIRAERRQCLERFTVDQAKTPEEEEGLRNHRRQLMKEFDSRVIDDCRGHLSQLAEGEVHEQQGFEPVTMTDAKALLLQRAQLPSMLLDDRSRRGRGSSLFLNLKKIHFIMTKADQYSICYPPSTFPRRRLGRCRELVTRIEAYLRILGGRVQYYNTSVTGYSFARDGVRYPSLADFQCPINVVEPFFDLIGLHSENHREESPL